jgi:hypothetical protein
MESSESNTEVRVATKIFFEVSMSQRISQQMSLTNSHSSPSGGDTALYSEDAWLFIPSLNAHVGARCCRGRQNT